MLNVRSAAVFALLLLAGCNAANQPAKPSIEVANAWARLPALADRPGAAYFTLRNNGAAAVLTGVQSPRVQRIELHMTHEDEDMTRMYSLGQIPIAAGETDKFEPGGIHAMLFGMDPKLKEGDQLPLTFVFRDGHKVNAQAKLVAVGAPAP